MISIRLKKVERNPRQVITQNLNAGFFTPINNCLQSGMNALCDGGYGLEELNKGDTPNRHPDSYDRRKPTIFDLIEAIAVISKSGFIKSKMETIMSKLPTVSFNDAELQIIDNDGQQWLTAADISRALGYSRNDSVTSIYNRNKAEFDDSMSLTVNLTVRGMPIKTRVFNKRGCQLIGFLAKTKKAAEFRKWALDVLAGQSPDAQIGCHGQNSQQGNNDTLWLCTQRNGEFIRQERADAVNISQIVNQYLPDHIVINRNVAAKIVEQATDELQRQASKVATEAFLINTNLRTRLGLVESKGLVVGGVL